MVLPRLPDPSNPESVSAAEFDTRRRGFDPLQVRAYLKVVSRELQRLHDRESELQRSLVEMRAMHNAQPAEFDEDRAMVLLGEETTRVLGAARAAAAEKVDRANAQAKATVEAAEADAAEIRAGAHVAFDNELAAARAEGRAIIAEAKLVREKMLDELAVKRQALMAQLEQLRAGRDRLAESYANIRGSLDEVQYTLDNALTDAQIASRRAADRASRQPVATASSIERELADAARAGVPLVEPDEIAASLVDAEDEPASWVNAGTRTAAVDDPANEADELFGAWNTEETSFFAEAIEDNADAGAGADTAGADLDHAIFGDPVDDANDEVLETVDVVELETIVVEATATRPVVIIDSNRPEPIDDPAESPGIVLADLTRSRRDAGLPRDALPILDPPDAVEIVRVLRDNDEPSIPVARVEPMQVSPVDDVVVMADVESAPNVYDQADEQVLDEVELYEADAVVEEPAAAVAIVAEPEPEPAVVPARATRGPRVAEQAPVEPAPAAQTEPEPAPTPEPVAVKAATPVAAEPKAAEPAVDDEPTVDDLFERIRRNRAAKVARAEEVLQNAFFAPTEVSAADDATAMNETAESRSAESEPTAPVAVIVAEDRVGAVNVDDAEHFAQRDRTVEPLRAQIAKKLKRLLADEQNDVLDLVRRSSGAIDEDEVLPPLRDHAGRYVAAVGGELLAAVSAGAGFFSGGDPNTEPDLASLDAQVADEVVHPLRSLLGRAMAEGLAEDEVLDRVRLAYREVKSQRVDEASRTIVLAAFNAGVEASHVHTLVRWAVDPVHGCSADCDDNALEGAIAAGTEFPTGVTRPPGHAGCRCLLVPLQQ